MLCRRTGGRGGEREKKETRVLVVGEEYAMREGEKGGRRRKKEEERHLTKRREAMPWE